MQLRLHSVDDIRVVEFIGRALVEGPQLQELSEELYELIERRGPKRIIFDFSNVRFLASAALGLLVSLRQRIEYSKGQIVLCGLRPELRQVFTFARLDGLFAFHDTRAGALASFNAPTTE